MERPQSCKLFKVGEYILFELINESTFGTVYKAKNNSEEIFAVKKISISNLTDKRYSYYINEIEILKSFIDCPGIITIAGYLKTTNHLYIVTEFCKGLDLKMYLDRFNNVPWKIVKKFAKTILETMNYLHKHGIVHRDLKPSNLLMTDEDIEISDVKIADFGFAKNIGVEMAETQIGTPLYMAPETFGFQGHTYKADIWSLGITFYEFLYGFVPFQCLVQEDLKKINYNEVEFEENINVPLAAKEMIKAMLNVDPNLRPTYDELLQMEFITGVPKACNMELMDSSEIVFSEKYNRKGFFNMNLNNYHHNKDKAALENRNLVGHSFEIMQIEDHRQVPKFEIDNQLNKRHIQNEFKFEDDYIMCVNTLSEIDEYLALKASLQDIDNDTPKNIISYYISMKLYELDVKLIELETRFPDNNLILELTNEVNNMHIDDNFKPLPNATDWIQSVKNSLKSAIELFFQSLHLYPTAFKLLKLGSYLYPDEIFFTEKYEEKRIYFEE